MSRINLNRKLKTFTLIINLLVFKSVGEIPSILESPSKDQLLNDSLLILLKE